MDRIGEYPVTTTASVGQRDAGLRGSGRGGTRAGVVGLLVEGDQLDVVRLDQGSVGGLSAHRAT
jgi:hypothetical protein